MQTWHTRLGLQHEDQTMRSAYTASYNIVISKSQRPPILSASLHELHWRTRCTILRSLARREASELRSLAAPRTAILSANTCTHDIVPQTDYDAALAWGGRMPLGTM